MVLRRLAIVLAACVPLWAWPRASHGEWKSVQQVTLGTAQVLEQGALTVGVIAPLAFGASSRLMLQTHPILDLLLVPNISGRYRLAESNRYVVSAAGSFKRSFGETATAVADDSALAPGELIGGLLGTYYPSNRWAWTGGVFYAGHFDEPLRGEYRSMTQGVAATAEVHWLPAPNDLLKVSLYQRYGITAAEWDSVVITAAWTHGFERWLGGAHLMVVLTANDTQSVADAGGLLGLGWVQRLPVLPMVDLWWRL
jgi:hypothetical protein